MSRLRDNWLGFFKTKMSRKTKKGESGGAQITGDKTNMIAKESQWTDPLLIWMGQGQGRAWWGVWRNLYWIVFYGNEQ